MSTQGAPAKESGSIEFDDFVRRVDHAVAAAATIGRFSGPSAGQARWETGLRNAAVEAVAPRNLSLTLGGAAGQPVKTWYPVDLALVPVVSHRIAAHLGEA
jgi:hypothetical protein